MPHPCNAFNILYCPLEVAVGHTASAAVPAAWDEICKSFASAAGSLLGAFGKAFAAIPDVNPASAGISGAYAMSLVLAGSVAALLLFGQVMRTAWTHDGSGLAQGIAGVGKAVLAWLATAAVATASLAAADTATRWIVDAAFGSQQALSVRLGGIVNWAEVTGYPGQAAVGGSLLLVFALAGIVLVIVLWFELLLRNAAIAVLIAVSPIAAAGQVSETTKVWWQRTVSAAAQLIILKPVIALVFAVGFGMAGTSSGIEPLLSGLLVLFLAAFAWPVIARFFTFATVQATASGVGTALGFAAGRMSAPGGQPSGVNPSQWSLGAERRTMAARNGITADPAAEGGVSGGSLARLPGTGAGAAPAGAAPGSAAGGGAGSGGNGAAVAAGIGFALSAIHRAGTVLAGRMEQTAAHGGMHGAYPYSTVEGGRRLGSRGAQHPEQATPPPAEGQPPTMPGEPPATPGTASRADSTPPPHLPPAGEPGATALDSTSDSTTEGDQP